MTAVLLPDRSTETDNTQILVYYDPTRTLYFDPGTQIRTGFGGYGWYRWDRITFRGVYIGRYLNKLIRQGDVMTCPECNRYSCYAFVNYTGPNCTPVIETIGAASGDEWQCGHCKQYLVKRTSVYNNFGHRDD